MREHWLPHDGERRPPRPAVRAVPVRHTRPCGQRPPARARRVHRPGQRVLAHLEHGADAARTSTTTDAIATYTCPVCATTFTPTRSDARTAGTAVASAPTGPAVLRLAAILPPPYPPPQSRHARGREHNDDRARRDPPRHRHREHDHRGRQRAPSRNTKHVRGRTPPGVPGPSRRRRSTVAEWPPGFPSASSRPRENSALREIFARAWDGGPHDDTEADEAHDTPETRRGSRRARSRSAIRDGAAEHPVGRGAIVVARDHLGVRVRRAPPAPALRSRLVVGSLPTGVGDGGLGRPGRARQVRAAEAAPRRRDRARQRRRLSPCDARAGS